MIFFDFEFNDKMVLMCACLKDGVGDLFDLRDNRELATFKDYLATNSDEVFLSYSLSAEMESLLRLGIPVDKMRCIDLMAEARMITLSHDSYFTADSTMLGQLRALLKKDIKEDKEHKEKMRDLILTRESWSVDEWDELCLYCWSDIVLLPDLLEKIVEIHYHAKHELELEHMLDRGDYVRMSTEMDFASEGFPVYGGAVEKIYSNKPAVRTSIIKNLPYYWQSCYTKNKKGGWTLGRKAVIDLAKARGWWDKWKKTDSGLPCLEADYLDQLAVLVPEVKPLYTAQRALTTLNSADLRDQVVNGYVRTRTFAFSAKTGRNGLKPKHGFLLNLPKWMRRIVHPHPNMCLVGVDWSQQEIAIAAALSGDQKLITAYNSGDIYLALGKMSGHIPPDGTKTTHKQERDLFKALQLGLGYGKGIKSLGLEFYAIMKDSGISELDARIKAQEIYTWHKLHFSQYWNWVNSQVTRARLNGWIETSDHWVEWVSRRTMTTQLLNFPSQATGAVMMRNATKMFYRAWKAGNLCPVLCSQHDAFYFNCEISKIVDYVEMIESIMDAASKGLLGMVVRADTKIYDVEQTYIPDNWEDRHEKLWVAAVST